MPTPWLPVLLSLQMCIRDSTERRAHVGQVIRKYRTAVGMDQAALAARLGCTKTAIGNWELGLTRPDIDNVPRICRALKIPVTELLGIESEAALPRDCLLYTSRCV